MKAFQIIRKSLLYILLLSLAQTSQAGRTEVEYYHHDAQGSIVAASDENGDIIWQKTYDEYGKPVFTTEDGEEYEGQAYTGAPYDEETGLIYLGQRYYDPQIRRFLSPDPVGVPESILQNPTMFNRYAYANNNPYKYVDPDGRAPLFIEASKRQSMDQAMMRSAQFRASSMVIAGAGTGTLAAVPVAACVAGVVCGKVAGVTIAGGLTAESGDLTNLVGVSSINARKLLSDPGFIKRVKDVECTDCDDIARLLFKAAGNKGKILDLRNTTGSIKVREFGKIENFVDHRVFSDGKFVFDPRFSNNPVPILKYIRELRSLNPNLVIKDVTP